MFIEIDQKNFDDPRAVFLQIRLSQCLNSMKPSNFHKTLKFIDLFQGLDASDPLTVISVIMSLTEMWYS